jgi:hypothetical protein
MTIIMKLGKSRRLRSTLLLVCLTLLYIILQSAVWRVVDVQSTTTSDRFILDPQQQHQQQQWQQYHHHLHVPSSSSIEPIIPPVPSINLELEIQKGIDYARSITNIQRKLVFVHIPKSAGSAIEEVGGKQAQVAWGSCLFLHRPRRPGGVCRYPENQFEWPTTIGYWHLPTQFFPIMGVNPYHGADLFAVVRDPRDRLISEFYYTCRKKVKVGSDKRECDVTKLNDPAYLNDWLKKKLQKVPSILNTTAKEYLDQNGHFTPQSLFVFSSFDARMVDYVLRMDTLATDFPRLMDAYGLNVKLPPVKTNTARNVSADLDARIIDSFLDNLIHEKYDRDFDFFP